MTPTTPENNGRRPRPWQEWARNNVPDLPVTFVESAANILAYSGQNVTADAARRRVLHQYPDLAATPNPENPNAA